MKRLSNLAWMLIILLTLVVSACQPTPTPAPQPAPATVTASAPADGLYLAIVWHQHQPLYYKDPQTGVYTRPWVRVHATKDYYDMAAMLKNYPNVHVTFNLTPVLDSPTRRHGRGRKGHLLGDGRKACRATDR